MYSLFSDPISDYILVLLGICYSMVYSSYMGARSTLGIRETRPGPVISLVLEKASLYLSQESKYHD